jgi:hypothetical protein
MFLSYQHEVRNVIFHQDIPEFIIISVEWFFGLINVLIATFYESSSFECKKRGQISTDLLNQVIQNSRIDQSKQLENSATFFFKHSYYICSAFCRNKKWDIIVIHFCLLEFIGFLHTTNMNLLKNKSCIFYLKNMNCCFKYGFMV